jgi:hypothetical protein
VSESDDDVLDCKIVIKKDGTARAFLPRPLNRSEETQPASRGELLTVAIMMMLSNAELVTSYLQRLEDSHPTRE